MRLTNTSMDTDASFLSFVDVHVPDLCRGILIRNNISQMSGSYFTMMCDFFFFFLILTVKPLPVWGLNWKSTGKKFAT